MSTLVWSDFVPNRVFQAEGIRGIYIACPKPADGSQGWLYLMPKGQSVCPINKDRALAHMVTHNPQRRAEAWENDDWAIPYLR